MLLLQFMASMPKARVISTTSLAILGSALGELRNATGISFHLALSYMGHLSYKNETQKLNIPFHF